MSFWDGLVQTAAAPITFTKDVVRGDNVAKSTVHTFGQGLANLYSPFTEIWRPVLGFGRTTADKVGLGNPFGLGARASNVVNTNHEISQGHDVSTRQTVGLYRDAGILGAVAYGAGSAGAAAFGGGGAGTAAGAGAASSSGAGAYAGYGLAGVTALSKLAKGDTKGALETVGGAFVPDSTKQSFDDWKNSLSGFFPKSQSSGGAPLVTGEGFAANGGGYASGASQSSVLPIILIGAGAFVLWKFRKKFI